MENNRDTDYIDQILNIRAARDKRMKTNPQSWLALIGLFPLAEGNNTFGTDPSNKIALPGFIQKNCGSLHLEHGKIALFSSINSNLTVNNMPPGIDALHTDQDEIPDMIEVGSLTMKIIQRGEQYYLRVWDRDSSGLKNFNELKYFPVNPKFRIEAKFIKYSPPRTIIILNILGTESETRFFGEAHFTQNGVACSLIAEEDGDELLFSFTDKTREDTTYPGGRFLVTSKPEKDLVILDFNQAVNWPCAYTPYATCPLPPAENHLPVRIEAGEMRYQA